MLWCPMRAIHNWGKKFKGYRNFRKPSSCTPFEIITLESDAQDQTYWISPKRYYLGKISITDLHGRINSTFTNELDLFSFSGMGTTFYCFPSMQRIGTFDFPSIFIFRMLGAIQSEFVTTICVPSMTRTLIEVANRYS